MDILYFLLNHTQLKVTNFSVSYVPSLKMLKLKDCNTDYPTYLILIKNGQLICNRIHLYNNNERETAYPFHEADKFDKFYVLS